MSSQPPEPPPEPARPASRHTEPTSTATRRGVRLIVRFVRLHPTPFAASLVGGVLWSAMIIGLSMALRTVTDRGITPAFAGRPDLSGWACAALLFAAGVLRGGAVVIRRWFGSVTEARMQASLRRDAATRLVAMSPEATRSYSTGEFLARSDIDVTTATNLLMPLPFSMGVVALIVFALISLARTDVAFAAVALVMFPLLTVLSRYYSAKLEQPAGVVQARLGDLSAVAHESFDGVQVVKTLGREEEESARFGRAAENLRQARFDTITLSARYQPLFDAIPAVGTLVLLLVGAWRIGSGAVTEGELVQAVAIFGFLAFPMRIVGFMFESLPRAVVAVERVDELIALPVRRGVTAPLAAVPDGPLGLSIENVSFRYRTLADEPAGEAETALGGDLDAVTMRIEPGEVVALVGPTGSGKSTLIRLIAGLEVPDGGRIALVDTAHHDVDIASIDPVDYARAVSTAFQESFLFADSITANVAFGLESGPGRDVDGAVTSALQVARADGFVDALPSGAATVVGERGVTLSGGQRQRVALARALARRPRVLLLDDATSAVDPLIEREILDGLQTSDATMLVVAHRLSTIEICDRVVMVSDGRVVAQGRHDELLRSDPAYASLVTAYDTVAVGDGRS